MRLSDRQESSEVWKGDHAREKNHEGKINELFYSLQTVLWRKAEAHHRGDEGLRSPAQPHPRSGPAQTPATETLGPTEDQLWKQSAAVWDKQV